MANLLQRPPSVGRPDGALDSGAAIDLGYCVEWRPWLWTGAVRWALGDPGRFRNKRVLDLGSRFGKMSCYFGSLGAQVTGADLFPSYAEAGRREALKWNLSRQVEFVTYSGNLRDLRGPYDFVFTKSVLVVLGDQAAGIGGLLAETGEYIAVENMEGGWAVAGARRIIHRHWEGHRTYFKPLNRARISELASRFRSAESKEFLGLVVAIRARYPRPIS